MQQGQSCLCLTKRPTGEVPAGERPAFFIGVNMTFKITAQIDQIVTKEVQLLIKAESEEEAQAKARDALQSYPEAVNTPGVSRIVTNKSHYWIPKSIDFLCIKKVKGS